MNTFCVQGRPPTCARFTRASSTPRAARASRPRASAPSTAWSSACPQVASWPHSQRLLSSWAHLVACSTHSVSARGPERPPPHGALHVLTRWRRGHTRSVLNTLVIVLDTLGSVFNTLGFRPRARAPSTAWSSACLQVASWTHLKRLEHTRYRIGNTW